MKYRNLIAIGLAVLMLVMITIVVYNWEELSSTKTEIKYADGCIEIFKNDNLTTPECTEGRRLEELRKQQEGVKGWTIPN